LQQAHGFVPEAFAELPFHLDHIVAPQHGGHREASNLAPPVVSATDTKGQTSPAFGLRLPFVKAAFPCCLVRRFFSPQFQKDDCFAFMELRHVRYFIGVAEEENVSRAALKLHVSQPALSRQIRDLEEELGFLLLERSAKSVRLTEAGRLFLAEARVVLQRAEDAVKAARAIASGGSGELHVGYAPSLTAQILPQTLRNFQAEWPGVRVKLHDFSTEEMISGLREGKLQIAFVVRLTPALLRGLRFEELAQDPVCLAVSPKHPLAGRRTVTLAETAREPLFTYSRKEYPEAHEWLAAMFTSIKSKLRIAEEHDSVSSLIAAVEAGNGVAIAPQSLSCTAGPRLKLIPLSPTPEPLGIGAAWSKSGLTTAAERFLRCARAAVLKE
jgi:DNA-binding transcriptional LysR family regulator